MCWYQSLPSSIIFFPSSTLSYRNPKGARMTSPSVSLSLALLLVSSAAVVLGVALQAPNADGCDSTTVPAFPVAKGDNHSACHLDLSDELFGGVGEACARGGLDRSRCCPVLAAWLFAAHARYALQLRPPPAAVEGTDGSDGPMMPDDNQKCVDSLRSALEMRGIRLPRANATCDTILCFCGIRLHQIGSLRCPAAFNVSSGAAATARNATPTAAVRQLERDCLNSSYAGCTRCLHSLEKVKGIGEGSNSSGSSSIGNRTARMFGQDCQLMGLTWLLTRNRTAYIPTASAVLRAVLYSAHPPQPSAGDSGYKCSPDQENMPLAVDSLQFQQLTDSTSTAAAAYSILCPSRFALALNLLTPLLMVARLVGI